MKKVFFFVFAACCMTAAAQHVVPVNIQVVDLKLDSLRALYQTEPTMYRASLDVLSQQLAKNAEELKTAKAQLKAEQTHAKQMQSSLKEAVKMTASLKKLYGQEEKELKSMQKVVEGQQRNLSKQMDLSESARNEYTRFLETQQKELGYSIREVADRQRSITDLETSIQNGQTGLNAYMQELQQKATQVATVEAQLKERTAILKTEQKSAKSMQ